jgi:hypothetical protein
MRGVSLSVSAVVLVALDLAAHAGSVLTTPGTGFRRTILAKATTSSRTSSRSAWWKPSHQTKEI